MHSKSEQNTAREFLCGVTTRLHRTGKVEDRTQGYKMACQLFPQVAAVLEEERPGGERQSRKPAPAAVSALVRAAETIASSHRKV